MYHNNTSIDETVISQKTKAHFFKTQWSCYLCKKLIFNYFYSNFHFAQCVIDLAVLITTYREIYLFIEKVTNTSHYIWGPGSNPVVYQWYDKCISLLTKFIFWCRAKFTCFYMICESSMVFTFFDSWKKSKEYISWFKIIWNSSVSV